MYLLIDMGIDAIELAEASDTKRFHVAVVNSDDDATVEALLEAKGFGRLDPDDDEHVWIPVAAVQQLAAGRVHGTWAEDIDHMLEKAAKHGFYDAAKGEIKAHVEWVDSADGSN